MPEFEKVDNINSPSGAGLPSGIILIWTGTIASIPSGWVICDGNNGTPNLLDRFPQQVATGATDPGSTGGSTSQTGNGHTHPFPSHSHTGNLFGNSGNSYYSGSYTVAGYGHTHSSAGTMTYAGGTSASGTGSITDGRPKYYEVAFIMKT